MYWFNTQRFRFQREKLADSSTTVLSLIRSGPSCSTKEPLILSDRVHGTPLIDSGRTTVVGRRGGLVYFGGDALSRVPARKATP